MHKYFYEIYYADYICFEKIYTLSYSNRKNMTKSYAIKKVKPKN